MSNKKNENLKVRKSEKISDTASVSHIFVRAQLNYLRMSPTKVRAVTNLIKGMDVDTALEQLHYVSRIAKEPVEKLLNSAIANALNNFNLDRKNLYIKSFTVDGGPTLKRWRPRAFGRAGMIRKRTSHLQVILAEKNPTGKDLRTTKPKLRLPIHLLLLILHKKFLQE